MTRRRARPLTGTGRPGQAAGASLLVFYLVLWLRSSRFVTPPRKLQLPEPAEHPHAPQRIADAEVMRQPLDDLHDNPLTRGDVEQACVLAPILRAQRWG